MVVEGKICLTEKNVNEMKKKEKGERGFRTGEGSWRERELTRTSVHGRDLGHVPFREV